MNSGPTQRLLQDTRDWVGTAEELAALQWELLRRESAELAGGVQRSLRLSGLAVGFALLGAPLAIVGALVALAQSQGWSIAITLAIAGAALTALALLCWFSARQSWNAHRWLPRSRRQAAVNVRTVLASWKGRATLDDSEALVHSRNGFY